MLKNCLDGVRCLGYVGTHGHRACADSGQPDEHAQDDADMLLKSPTGSAKVA